MTLIVQRWMRASAFVLAVLPAALASAQQSPPSQSRGAPAATAPPKAAAPAPRESAPAPNGAPAGDAALRQRIEQLEEQLVDMQVVVGTLESLARGAPAPAAPGRPQPGPAAAFDAAEAGRLDSMETQIRALAAQVGQLQEQMRALASRTGSLPPAASVASSEPGGAPRPGRPQLDAPAPPERTGFGSVTVSPDTGRKDEIDRVLGGNQPGPGNPPGPQMAAAPSEAEVNAKQLYESAYGYLLQRDYGAAESAFEDFLRRHPNDPLAGNAQYWLGESLYVRGQYRAAAGAFLKGYQTYARSPKAPESLLKLAMSLQRLGQKDAACTSYSELNAKFPTAPAHVKSTAQSERQKAGC
jgi:tol-pal system protein YbgF